MSDNVIDERKIREMSVPCANLYEYSHVRRKITDSFSFTEIGVILVKDKIIFDRNRTEPLPEGVYKNMAYGIIVSDIGLLGQKLLLKSVLGNNYVFIERNNINLYESYNINNQLSGGNVVAEPIANDGVVKIDDLIKKYARINEKAYERAKADYFGKISENEAIKEAQKNMDELFG